MVDWMRWSVPMLLLACHSGPKADVHCKDQGKDVACDVEGHNIPNNQGNVCFDVTVTCDDDRRPGTHLCYGLMGRPRSTFAFSAVARAVNCQGKRTGISVSNVTVAPSPTSSPSAK